MQWVLVIKRNGKEVTRFGPNASIDMLFAGALFDYPDGARILRGSAHKQISDSFITSSGREYYLQQMDVEVATI